MMITAATPAGQAEAWLARPAGTDGGEQLPGVLLFMDAIGLRQRIFDMADRIASWGYTVLAPNVFYRSGTAAETSPTAPLDTDGARSAFLGQATPRVGALTVDQVLPDIAAYLEILTSRPEVSSPVGVVGYCMGANLAVRAAAAHPDLVAACAGFHGGGLATDDPGSPHLALATARAEFVFGHAEHDRSMAPDAIARLGAALDETQLTASNEVSPDVAHGYTMADTTIYDQAATERHFTALRDLFDRTLR